MTSPFYTTRKELVQRGGSLPAVLLPVADALASIDGAYDLVYSYDATNTDDTDDPWQKYDPNAPPLANYLKQMEAKQAYWIKTKQDVTWTVRRSVTP